MIGFVLSGRMSKTAQKNPKWLIKTWNDNTPPLSCRGQITVENGRNLPISKSKLDLHNINAHIKFDENSLRFTCYCPKMKIRMFRGQITLSKIDENCPLGPLNQICTILMHIPSLVKIHWYLLKLSSRNENTDGQTDEWTGRRTNGRTHQHQRETEIKPSKMSSKGKGNIQFNWIHYVLIFQPLAFIRKLN